MSDKKISELNSVSSLSGSEILPIVQSGETKKVTAQEIADLASGSGGAVDSVNGQTGVVVLDASDVGAATAAQGTLADTAVQPDDLAEVATTGDYDDLLNKPALASVATSGSYNDLDDLPSLDFASSAQGDLADTALQTLLSKNVVVVSRAGDNLTATGSHDKPFQTIQAAFDYIKQAAQDEENVGPSTGVVILVLPGQYNENVTINADATYVLTALDILGLPASVDSQPTKIAGKFVIEGTNTTRVRIRDIQLSTRPALEGGLNTDIALTITDTQGRFYFENVTVTQAINNPAVPTILVNGNYRRWIDFTRSNWNGEMHLTGSPVSGATVLVSQNNNSSGRINIDQPNYTVRVHDCQRTGHIYHQAGKLLIHNIAEMGQNDDGDAITSTADDSDANNKLVLLDVNLYGITFETETFGNLNKSGNCPYILKNVTRGMVNDTLNGSVEQLGSSALDINASRAATNYWNANDSVTSHLEGIDSALDKFTGDPYKFAYFNDEGTLQDSDLMSYSSEGGLNLYKDEYRSELNDPTYRNIHNVGHNLEATEDMINEFTQLHYSSLQVDNNNSGYNYGDDSPANGGVGLFAGNVSHRGSGNLGRVNYRNDFIDLGQQGIEGSANYVQGYNLGVAIREDYEVTNVMLNSNYYNQEQFSLVGGLVGTLNSVTVNENAELDSYCNLFQGNITNDGSFGNVNALDMSIGGTGAFDYLTFINLNFQQTGPSLSAVGMNVSFANDVDAQNSPTGIQVNMGTYDSTTQRRVTFSGQGGAFSNTQEISTLPNMFFDQANILYNMFLVKAGEPIVSTAFISNNFSTGFYFQDDMDAGIMGLGATGVGFVGQLAVEDTKTAALVNFCAGGASIPDFPNSGGTVLRANIFAALGIVDQGGANDTTVNEVCAFYMGDASLGVAKWGIDIADDTAENRLAKSLVIGSNTNTVTNNDIALELSEKKAFKLTGMTVAERDALTAAFGMVVAIDDGGTQELHFYNGTSWVTL